MDVVRELVDRRCGNVCVVVVVVVAAAAATV